MVKNTELFSDRSIHYVKGRPHYPAEIAAILDSQCGLSEKSIVADIGAGTGIFTELLLRTGCTVYCVEPNDEMRKQAEMYLNGAGNCRFVDGTSEHTTLDDGSVDIVTVAQALHWFDIPATRLEFSRILRAGGWVVIIKNSHRRETEFEREWAKLRKRHSVKKSKLSVETYDALYGNPSWQEQRIFHQHDMNWDTLVARLLSRSGVPIEGEPGFDELIADLRSLFERHHKSGIVTQGYEAKVLWGQIS